MGGMSLMRGCRWPTGACLGAGRMAAAESLWSMRGCDLIPPAPLSVAWTIDADPSSKLATTIPTPDIIDISNSPDFELACDALCVSGQDRGVQLHQGFVREILRYLCNHGRRVLKPRPIGLFRFT